MYLVPRVREDLRAKGSPRNRGSPFPGQTRTDRATVQFRAGRCRSCRVLYYIAYSCSLNPRKDIRIICILFMLTLSMALLRLNRKLLRTGKFFRLDGNS